MGNLPWQALLSRWASAASSTPADRIRGDRELRQVMKEFDHELAVLKGRGDGLEAKVRRAGGQQFLHPPPSSAAWHFVVGATLQRSGECRVDIRPRPGGATTFSLRLQLSFDTAFTQGCWLNPAAAT